MHYAVIYHSYQTFPIYTLIATVITCSFMSGLPMFGWVEVEVIQNIGASLRRRTKSRVLLTILTCRGCQNTL